MKIFLNQIPCWHQKFFWLALLLPISGFSQTFAESTLPIIEINTLGQPIPMDGKITAVMEITFKGNGLVTNINDVPNIWSGAIEIDVHGASSSGYPQKSYNIKTMMNATLDSNVVILGMPREHDWILINNWNEKSFVRNTIPQRMFSEMGHYGVRMKHCEVTLNGEYIGIYLLSEKIKVDKARVAISKLTATDNTGVQVSGGYIIKNDVYYPPHGWPSNYYPVGLAPTDHPYFLYEYPATHKITAQQRTYIMSYMDSLETALYSSNFADPIVGYRKFISQTSFMDYFLINELSRNVDGNKKSSYWHKNRWDKGGKMEAGPVWDFDWAWKNIYDCPEFSNTDGSGWSYKIVDCEADALSFGWFKRLLQDPHFANAVNCRWKLLRNSILSEDKIFDYIDSVEVALDAPQKRHFAKFPELGKNNGAPEVEPIATTYHGELLNLKSWIHTRIAWLDQNMVGECDLTTSVSKTNESKITFYPNPTNGSVVILNAGKRQPYTLFNTLGSMVDYGILEEGENAVQLNVVSGLYLLKTPGELIKIIVRSN